MEVDDAAHKAVNRDRRYWHLMSCGWPTLTFTATYDCGVQIGWKLRLGGEPTEYRGETIFDCLEAANRLEGARQPDA